MIDWATILDQYRTSGVIDPDQVLELAAAGKPPRARAMVRCVCLDTTVRQGNGPATPLHVRMRGCPEHGEDSHG